MKIRKRSFCKIEMYGLLVILTALLLCIIGRTVPYSVPKQVVLNEVCSSNFTLIRDENGAYSDYVELYNAGSEEISLTGCYLSDDAESLWKYPLDSITLSPGAYYVVWLDGTDDPESGRVGFGISKSGEEIFLSSQETGEIMDSVKVPALVYNTSDGRVRDGEDSWSKMTATAGSSNEEAQILPSVELENPVFSVESGFYEEPFSLEISAGEGEVVYYTLDGSNPSTDSAVYREPILIEDVSPRENVYAARTDLAPTRDYTPPFPVDKAMIVRAVSYCEQDNTMSEIVSGVYFVGYEEKELYDGLSVLSIVTDPDNLFDYDYGIYGNGAAMDEYREHGMQDGELLESYTDEDGNVHYRYMASNAFHDGKEWEREASVTYFDEEHMFCFTQNVGIRIAGQSTRSSPKKSLNLYGRTIYDEKALFPLEFFPGTVYSNVKLRVAEDIRDAFLVSLVKDRAVSVQKAEPCVVFLNGEYWGIYDIRERYKEEYLRNYYDVSAGNVWIMDADAAAVGGSEAQEAYQYMNALITECDLSYDDVYAMVCECIDVQSLIDYCCINLYVDNRDVSFATNTALWRTIEPEDSVYGDCKWRWMLFDLDDTLHPESAGLGENALFQEPVIQSLMANAQFRKQFCVTYMDIANTIYAYDTVHEELMQWRETYGKQIILDRRRFDDMAFAEESLNLYIEEIDNFFKNRFLTAMKELKEQFGLEGELAEITIAQNIPEGGFVQLNTAALAGETWSGQFFTDYPILLTAVPAEGYHFAGWRGDVTGTEDRMEVSLPENGLRVEAIFEKD